MKRYILWENMMLFYGTLPKQVILHQHPVIQLVIGVDGSFLKKGENNQWEALKSLLVAPNIAHECDAAGQKIFSLNIDPESKFGGNILQSLLAQKEIISFNQQTLKYFDFDKIEHLLKTEKLEKLHSYICQFFYQKMPEISFNNELDDRIIKVRQYVEENIPRKFETKELCELVFLSESRLLHLFKEQVGIPIRNYILWIRLKKAIELVMVGNNLTYAAHQAGFSDSSHMSKTFVKSIGMNPAELFKNSKFIQVCEVV